MCSPGWPLIHDSFASGFPGAVVINHSEFLKLNFCVFL